MNVKILTRIDFDNLENRSATVKNVIKVFDSHGAVYRWFQDQTPVELYLGWDGQVYPQFTIDTVNVE